MEELKILFDKLGVYYEIISDIEIRVVCPAIRHKNHGFHRTTATEDTITKIDFFCSLQDEGCILIKEIDGELNWTIVV